MNYQNHHYNQQHQQWPPRPPTQGTANACPTCSFHHFPFCPPNPNSFHQPSPGLQFAADPSFHRPGAPARPYAQPPYEYGANGFAAEGDRSYKRPRVDDFGFGAEDERRLRLIRDHGAGLSPNPSNFDPRNPYLQHHGVYNPNPYEHGSSRFYLHHQPPLPASPPLPSLFPVGSAGAIPSPVSEAQSMAQPYFNSKSFPYPSSGFATQDVPTQYSGENRAFLGKPLSPEKPTVVEASQLFKQPHRATRPDHFVIILRGLPGSGKTYLAKMLRDIEVENGGTAPRIHSMDDYFMTEVEKVEESDHSKSSGSVRGKKPTVKTVMEYCYEPEMEEAYRSSMLRAFRKTLEEGDFTFVIVDDRNLRKADFAQFWAIAKSSGYEVYILEAPYKDPAGCAARNVHGFTLDDIQMMAGQWEDAPSFHLQLDAKSLFSGDDLRKSGIQEVDMDMEDEDMDESPSELQDNYSNNPITSGGNTVFDTSKDGKSGNGAEENGPKVKELGRSKWSNDLDEDGTEKPSSGNINALSGLIQAYHDEAKSVRWGDKGGNSGFAIKAAKKSISFSLEIGPGSGYNLKSNPLPEESSYLPRKNGEEPKSVFQEQLRAESESFKAVFFKRQQRVGLDFDDE